MKIEHLAIYVTELEKSKEFYCTYFQGEASEKYVNSKKGFSSYFIQFEGGCRLELMHLPQRDPASSTDSLGLHHFAISLGSREIVDQMTERFRRDGLRIAGEPRYTGDGYYESIIMDPDGNLIELTV